MSHTKDTMRVALVQTACTLGKKDQNTAAMARILEECDADLYVFPELFLTGYMVRDEIFRQAVSEDSPHIKQIQELAEKHDAHILFGAAFASDIAGIICNSAVLVMPDGRLQKYDKIHLANFGPFEEGFYFAEGGTALMVDINGFRCGLQICYDLFFPELSAEYAAAGADCLLCISASPVTSRASFEAVLPARAVENAAYVIYVNHAGTQLNQVFFGGSTAIDPSGKPLAKNAYFTQDVSVVTLCKSQLAQARRSRPTLRNRLPCKRNIDVLD